MNDYGKTDRQNLLKEEKQEGALKAYALLCSLVVVGFYALGFYIEYFR